MHILFVMYGWDDTGGGTIFPRQIVESLIERGHRVSVVYTPARLLPGRPSYQLEVSEENGFRLFAIFNRPALFYDLEHPEREVEDPSMCRIFADILDEVKPDLVHYHSFLNFSMAIAREVSKRDIPSVYTSHNYWPLCPRMYLFGPDLTLCEGPSEDGKRCAACIGVEKAADFARRREQGISMFAQHIDRHLAVSQRVRDLFVANGHEPSRIQVLHQAPRTVDSIWREVGCFRRFVDDLDRPLRVGFFGSLLSLKGVHVLVQALQHFEEGVVEGVIFGSGPEQYVEWLAQLDQQGMVRFHGAYQLSELPQLLESVDVVVVSPITEDCAPLVVTEALAARCPVIGSRIGGVPDFIREGVNGWLFEPRNPYDLAQQLHRFILQPELLGEMQRQIHAPLCFDDYLDELLRHYEDVGGQHARKPQAIVPCDDGLELSVVITTFNRPDLLKRCLQGFARQTLDRGRFEVIVVDDGSTVPSQEIVELFADQMTLRYHYQPNAGLAAARNRGIELANGRVIVPYDDDNYPHEECLEEHFRFHREHPALEEAMLAYLEWAPELDVSPLMHYLTKVDSRLWGFEGLRHGQILPFGSLWGGCSSYKKALIARAGGFDPIFTFGYEDTEAEFRMQRLGLRTFFNRRAINYVASPIDYDDFCRRCYKQGKSLVRLQRMYFDEPQIRDYCQIRDPHQALQRLEPLFEKADSIIRSLLSYGWSLSKEELEGLFRILPSVFDYWKYRGIVEVWAEGNRPKRILVIAPELPTFDRSSGAFRLFQIIELFRQAGTEVTFIARAAAGGVDPTPYLQKLGALGVRVYPFDSEKVFQRWGVQVDVPAIDLRALLQENQYDLAYLYFYELADQYLEEIRRYSPQTRIVVDSVDIHFLREERQAELLSDPSLLAKAKQTKDDEIRVYRQADLVVTVTKADREALLLDAPELNVDVIPNIHPIQEHVPPFLARQHVLFVGGFAHQPNVDAMLYFCSEIWPIVRGRIPDVKLFIVGSNPPESILALAGEGIVVTGYVPDTLPYLQQCRVSVAPLRYGAGMKGKVGEAMAAGLPVVATSVAAEGMGLEPGRDILVADAPALFAEQVIRLYEDPDLWQRLSEESKNFLQHHYSPSAVATGLMRLLEMGQSARVEGKAAPLCSIVIPLFNQVELTRQCLTVLAERTPEDFYEVILVDNASTDGTSVFLDSLEGDVRIIRNVENRGFAKACNQGAAIAKGKYVLFLNNDTIPHSRWLDALVELAEADEKIGIVGSKLLYPDGTIQHAGIAVREADGEPAHYHLYLCQPADAPHVNKVREFQFLTGACLLIRRDLFEGIGGFDEGYLNGHEDLDLCLSARAKGYKVMYSPQSVLTHLESRTKRLLDLDDYHYKKGVDNQEARNRARFNEKWGDFIEIDDHRYYAEDGFLAQVPNAASEASLHVLFTMFGWDEEGGGTILPRQIAKALVRMGHRVSVIYVSTHSRPGAPSYHLEEGEEDGVHLFGIHNFPHPLMNMLNPDVEIDDPEMVRIIAQLLTRLRPDLVHYHNFLGFSMGIAREINGRGLPSVFTGHNYWVLCPRLYLFEDDLTPCRGPSEDGRKCAVCLRQEHSPAYAERREAGRRLLGQYVDRHLAVSRRLRQLFVENGHAEPRIHFLQQQPETVDRIWQGAGVSRRCQERLERPLRVGFIGSLIPQKGCHVLVKALQLFSSDQIEAHFFGGAMPDYLELLKSEDQRGLVRFQGGYVVEQLPALLAEVDVVVVPSIWEDCAPLVVAEALAARCPVIGSRIGGIPDFIREGETGFLFEPNDEVALASLLRRFLEDPTLLGKMQRQIEPPKGFQAYLEELIGHYRQVLFPLERKKTAFFHHPRWKSEEWRLVLDAFLHRFSADDEVTLVLWLDPSQGVSKEEAETLLLAEIEKRGAGTPDILLLSEAFDEEQLRNLYWAVDGVVAPEDTAEARRFGRPVLRGNEADWLEALRKGS